MSRIPILKSWQVCTTSVNYGTPFWTLLLSVVYINGRPAVRDDEIWLRTVKKSIWHLLNCPTGQTVFSMNIYFLNTQASKNIHSRVHTNVQSQSTNVQIGVLSHANATLCSHVLHFLEIYYNPRGETKKL